MVELFAAAAFFSGPRTDQVRSGRSPGSELPTPAGLNGVSNSFELPTPEPPVWDYAALAASPASITAARLRKPQPSLSASPPLLGHRIECRDYSPAPLRYEVSEGDEGLLRQASVEPDERLSTHPALRVGRSRDSDFPPLSLDGESRFTRHDRPSELRQPRSP